MPTSTQLQRFIAIILLLSIMIQSCTSNLNAGLEGFGTKSRARQLVTRQPNKALLPISPTNDSPTSIPTALKTLPAGPNPPESTLGSSSSSPDTSLSSCQGEDISPINGNQSDRLINKTFTASGGEQVQLQCLEGQWKAAVTFPDGKIKELPVVCSPNFGVEDLLKCKSKQLQQRRIHVYFSKEGNGVVYIGTAGLPAGTGRRQGIASTQRRSSLEPVQMRMEQRDIGSTEALVAALNAVQELEEQQTLLRWAQVYIEWFNEQAVGNLTMDPSIIQNYTHLAHIKATPAHIPLLRGYFTSICLKVKESEYTEIALLQALEYALQHVDRSVFSSNPAQLIELANELLEKLNPTRTVFSESTYPRYHSMLCCIHHALVHIKHIAPNQWHTHDGGLYQHFKTQLDGIDQHTNYYPFKYHIRVLQQALKKLEEPNEESQEASERLGHLAAGILESLQMLANLATGAFINVPLARIIASDFQKAFGKRTIAEQKWYDALLQQTEQEEDCEGQAWCNALLQQIEQEGDCLELANPEERKALRFGIITNLGMLALHGPNEEIRSRARLALDRRATEWTDDPDLVEAMLNSFAALAVQDEPGNAEAAKDSLKKLINSNVSTASPKKQPLIKGRVRQEPPIQIAKERWLGTQSLEDKLGELRKLLPTASESSSEDRLFRKVSEYVGPPTSVMEAGLPSTAAPVVTTSSSSPVATQKEKTVAATSSTATQKEKTPAATSSTAAQKEETPAEKRFGTAASKRKKDEKRHWWRIFWSIVSTGLILLLYFLLPWSCSPTT